MIDIIILDDHDLFRLGIRSALQSTCPDVRIMGEANNGRELLRLLETETPDIVLLDIILPDISGIEIAQYLRQERPYIKILAISSENTEETLFSLLDIGINGFVSKRSGCAEVITRAIHAIAHGGEYFGLDTASIISDIYRSKREHKTVPIEFTKREIEIIQLCHIGMNAKEIADKLYISIRTVHTHKQNIFAKLGINNQMEMVHYALQHSIITL
jgi:DNA-binding NarL/FixJ family response regulator